MTIPFPLHLARLLGLTSALLGLVPESAGAPHGQERPRLILDADTANEIDDMYAITRMLRQDRYELIGLNSAQWFHALSGTRTVFASQTINEDLLRLHGREDVPALLGSDMEFGMPWGGEEPRDSAAARFIIDEARKTPDGAKLVVVCIGASTNLASALKLAPDIAPRIRAYLMGFRYDATKAAWNKSEFNVRRDLNAADLLLNCEELELHVMDANVSFALKFDRDDAFTRQAQMGELGAYLTAKWKARFADATTWVMWDLALVQALLHPEWATEREVETPRENRTRKVWVYESIDAQKMQEDFWTSVRDGEPEKNLGATKLKRLPRLRVSVNQRHLVSADGAAAAPALAPLAPLRVHASATHRETADGTPFVWIGDTAWELFHRLNREETGHYLERRATQGFTVIQAVVLAENDGLRTPNAYGDVPLIDLDPTKPNEAYFKHVDWIVDEAGRQGLYVGMLPTWGDKLFSLHPAAGPIVFNPQNAYIYGRFLGTRYREKPIVWILGGDRNVDSPEVLDIWRAMARGLREGDGGSHLISFHPRGENSSSETLHNEPWLDFNMYQSGHARRPVAVYRFAAHEALLQPRKPFLDAEPAYEDIPIAFWEFVDWKNPRRVPPAVLDDRGLIADRTHFAKGFFNAHDVRVHAYWNFLSGACGYTYGNNAVWQMYRAGQDIAIPCLYDWRESLERPGAQQIKHVRALFESRSLARLVPDQSLVYGPNPEGPDHVRAAGSSDRSFALLYLPQGKPVSVVLGKTAGDEVLARWFDPRTGDTTAPQRRANTGIAHFTPPDEGADRDWLLMLDQPQA